MATRRAPYRPPDLSRDHARPRTAPAPPSPAVEERLTDLVTPVAFALGDEYRRLGLRERVLGLPVVAAVVPAMVWRQVPSVGELGRVPAREGLLRAPPTRVSPQALGLRLRCLPEALFARVLAELLPPLAARAAARSRPRPPAAARARARLPAVRAVDGTTQEALSKRAGLPRGAEGPALGGTPEAVLDLATERPVRLRLDPDPAANDERFLDRLGAALPPGALLVMDRGFYSFPFSDWLTATDRRFVTRARSLAALSVERVLHDAPPARDRIVRLGAYRSNPCAHPVRLVEAQVRGTWRAYSTNVLDPAALAAADVVDRYGRRWRAEEAFLPTKRLLGLSDLWSGAFNAVAVQAWAAWLPYAALVDLTDAVAEELDQPLEALSLEMAYRGLYHFAVAFQRGEARDPVAYLAAPANRALGAVRRRRKYRERTRLDITAAPANL